MRALSGLALSVHIDRVSKASPLGYWIAALEASAGANGDSNRELQAHVGRCARRAQGSTSEDWWQPFKKRSVFDVSHDAFVF